MGPASAKQTGAKPSGYFENWKELVLHPDGQIKKRKFGESPGTTFAMLLAMACIGASVAAFGKLGEFLSSVFHAGPAEIFIAFAFMSIIGAFAVYFLVHAFSRALGGKGSYMALLAVGVESAFPFSLFSLVYFVPYVGQPLSVLSGLLSLVVVWVQFKYLRLSYGLSRNRAIGAIIGAHIAWLLLVTMVFFLIAYAAIMSYLSSGGAQPIISPTASGYHYYSPLHGGYSFDYPRSLERVSLNDSGDSVIPALLQNELFSAVLLKDGTANRTIMLFFIARQQGGGQQKDYPCESLVQSPSGKTDLDLSQAAVSKALWGKTSGCLIQNARDRETGEASTMFIAEACGSGFSHSLGAICGGNDYSAMKKIIESLRCGTEAVK